MPDEESACPALSGVPLLDAPLSDAPLSDPPLSDVPLPEVPLSDVLPLAWLPEDVLSLPRDEDSEADDSPLDESDEPVSAESFCATDVDSPSPDEVDAVSSAGASVTPI